MGNLSLNIRLGTKLKRLALKPKGRCMRPQRRHQHWRENLLSIGSLLRNQLPLWTRLQSDISDVKYEERRRTEDTERTTVKRIYDQATKEGLKTDEELDYFSYRYSKTDPSLSVEDRTTQAVESTKTGLGKLREGLVTKQELDKKDKDDLKVLGRGSSRTEKSEKKEDRPTTMSQQLAELNEKRKLKKDDI